MKEHDGNDIRRPLIAAAPHEVRRTRRQLLWERAVDEAADRECEAFLDEKRREVADKVVFIFGRDHQRRAHAIENLRLLLAFRRCAHLRTVLDARSVPADEQGAAKMSQRALIISLQGKTRISLTTVAGQSSMDLVADGLKAWSRNRFIYRFRGRRWGCHRESLPVAPGRPVRPVREAG